MRNWTDMIDRCFGLEDRPFAQHPSSEQDAFELLAELRRRCIGWPTFERELRQRLDRMPKLDTDEQVQLVGSYFKIWMLD